MSGRPLGAKNTPNPAMTFIEIGRRLGISPKLAYSDYCRGMYKIRRNTDGVKEFRDLVIYRRQLQDRRESSGFGVEQ